MPKSFSREFAKHRPIVPDEPMMAVVVRALLMQKEDHLQPEWLRAEGFVRRGSAARTFRHS